MGVPEPLCGLTWLDRPPRPIQIGLETWIAGIPAHPAWDRLEKNLDVKWPRESDGPHRRDDRNQPIWLIPKSQARLYRSRDFGPWQELARFLPETDKGWVSQVVPLQDGSFLAIAMESFNENGKSSPLARMYLRDGRLVMGDLLPLAATAPDGKPLRLGTSVIRWTAKGVLLAGFRSAALLDSRDGHLLWFLDLRVVLKGRIPFIECLQPTPSGDLVMAVSCIKARSSDKRLDQMEVQVRNPDGKGKLDPADDLIRTRVLEASVEGDVTLQWLRVDGATGRLDTFAPPGQMGSRSVSRLGVPFLLRTDGSVKLL
jgi:hypothetical protein